MYVFNEVGVTSPMLNLLPVSNWPGTVFDALKHNSWRKKVAR